MKGFDYIQELAAKGRYHFTVEEATGALGVSPVAVRAVLRRLKQKNLLVRPYREFYTILPPEYRSLGCLPPEQFIPQLMERLGLPYYVGLLSAAEMYGAAHHRPQEFQVIVERNRPGIHCGKVSVAFVARKNIQEVPTESRNTPRGMVKISTPEATAIDLVIYYRHAGGFDNVATVLSELSLDSGRLAVLAPKIAEPPVIQRLGYLLERVGHKEAAALLREIVRERVHVPAFLVPSAKKEKASFDPDWKLYLNAQIEGET